MGLEAQYVSKSAHNIGHSPCTDSADSNNTHHRQTDRLTLILGSGNYPVQRCGKHVYNLALLKPLATNLHH